MKKVGFVGWRGMVGSVLRQRMVEEEDEYPSFEAFYFSTSQVGGPGPRGEPLLDAFSVTDLGKMDIIVTCQGGKYTEFVYPDLRRVCWQGYWLDAASTLRMQDDAVIVLDPINSQAIDQALFDGIKTFVGGNCTVSLMLMALAGLFKEGLIEWVSSMTYQAASGAGANNMIELVNQMRAISAGTDHILDRGPTALRLEENITNILRGAEFPISNFGHPLAANLLPWIDTDLENGQSREEWKGQAETNKILATNRPIPVDGLCVRVGSLRCHSQALTIKLNRFMLIDEVETILGQAHKWVTVVPNFKVASLSDLTPVAVTDTLDIRIGRIRDTSIGPQYLTAFTVGDQLLWGAAEPIRRMLSILLHQ